MTESQPNPAALRFTARALLLGDRIDIGGLERADTISTSPLAFGVGQNGKVALYRYGVAVMVGLTPLEEEDVLARLKDRVVGAPLRKEDEVVTLLVGEPDDRIAPGGQIALKDLSSERFLVFADAIAKSVALARDEREVNIVFDKVEPLANVLGRHGRPMRNRREMLRLIGQALGVQHRVSGRVAVEDKPDVLWDRPDLERLYARLEDEYELKERGQTLQRKLDVIVETVRALTDIIDADRSSFMELAIVLLIIAEIGISLFEILFVRGH
ncbi:RMD1 family protein [Rhodoblastus sp.]|uniref:RMD1 family protein n=1 Tax=Rhodoblastus sp. TaxID=1962975 RepID=UPI002635E8B9|nr:RMD1 family protein [Rhodoblastus sp.]